MSGFQAKAIDDRRRRRMSIFLEVLPIVAGFALLLEELLSYLVFSLSAKDDGRTWYYTFSDQAPPPLVYLTDCLLLAVICAVMVALVVFFASGAGWIDSGRVVIGLLIMFGRGYVSLWVLAYPLGDATAFEALIAFFVSIVMAACSALALALVTRSRARASVA